MIRTRLLCVFFLFSAVTWIGCSDGNIQQTTYPVTGAITLDGKPLKGATVVLHAVDKSKFKWEELPQGITDENGKFSLFTYSAKDGAPASEYKVGIAVLQAPQDEGGDQVKRETGAPKLPTKYGDARTSGLSATVPAKTTVLPTFELSSK